MISSTRVRPAQQHPDGVQVRGGVLSVPGTLLDVELAPACRFHDDLLDPEPPVAHLLASSSSSWDISSAEAANFDGSATRPLYTSVGFLAITPGRAACARALGSVTYFSTHPPRKQRWIRRSNAWQAHLIKRWSWAPPWRGPSRTWGHPLPALPPVVMMSPSTLPHVERQVGDLCLGHVLERVDSVCVRCVQGSVSPPPLSFQRQMLRAASSLPRPSVEESCTGLTFVDFSRTFVDFCGLLLTFL